MALCTAAFDTEFSADSVEFCPVKDYQQYAAVGTYQVLDPLTSEDSKAATQTNRTGRLYVYDVDQSASPCADHSGEGNALQVKEVYRQDTSAVLDIKWSHQILNDAPVAAVVTSTGDTHIMPINSKGEMKVDMSLSNSKTNILSLSVDWANRININAGYSLAVSESDGSISNLTITPDAGLVKQREWEAHQFEAWIVGFNYHQTSTIYSGGDDCLFKGWDTRQDGNTPTFINKSHQAGVCSIASHPVWEHILATGSYDESIYIWDTRSIKRPVSTIPTGGGVWRLKWHPTDPQLLLSACMYNGFHIYRVASQDAPKIDHIQEYMGHKSIAYGADWSYSGGIQGSTECRSIVGTCSFYDHLLHFWIRASRESTNPRLLKWRAVILGHYASLVLLDTLLF
ncbi:hypothetical protein BASA60_001156 [Batrachochytrium salamandrivorans]|nr:hypothetical protein BASA60_001156 [Batrachochytrium salamandrivorans]